MENLDFTGEKTRERHGRRRFRQLISGMPIGRLKARLLSMAARDRGGYRTAERYRSPRGLTPLQWGQSTATVKKASGFAPQP